MYVSRLIIMIKVCFLQKQLYRNLLIILLTINILVMIPLVSRDHHVMIISIMHICMYATCVEYLATVAKRLLGNGRRQTAAWWIVCKRRRLLN
jgi:hypothetical protein